jgi:hypothetical protein
VRTLSGPTITVVGLLFQHMFRLRQQIWLLGRLYRQIFGSCGFVGKLLLANIWLLPLRWQICGSVRKFDSCASSVGKYDAALSANMRLCQQICFCGSSVGKDEAPPANLASPSANIWLRRLCRQSFCSDGQSSFSAAQSANIWLRRRLFGYVGK